MAIKKIKRPVVLRNVAADNRLFLLLILLLKTAIVSAQGDLLLFPKRIVFEGNTRMQSVSLINTGTDTVNYLISVVQYKMQSDGQFVRIEKPDSGQFFADPFLRIYPRQILLPPGKAQVVKIQLINTDALLEGEYRSHLYFRAEPDKKPLGEEESSKSSSSISVHVVTVFGISIPVIIRSGESNTTLAITNMQLEKAADSSYQLLLTLNRAGNKSVYGDVIVNYINEDGGTIQVGKLSGMAFYTPYSTRIFRIALSEKKGVDFKKGMLHITYQTQPDARQLMLTEKKFILL